MPTPEKRRGRPPKGVETSSIKIESDVRDLARQAGWLRGETIVEYISRTVREVAEAEILADAHKKVAAAEAKMKVKAKPKAKDE